MADDTYEFLIHLTDGQKVVADVGASDLERLAANNPDITVPADATADPLRAAATLLFSTLAQRVDAGTGAAAIRDRDGRTWIVPAGSIVAFSYRAPGQEPTRELGYVRQRQRYENV